MATPIQEIYPFEDDLVQAYYENCEPEALMNRGALPQWAVRAIHRWYKETGTIAESEHPFDVTDGFEIVDTKALNKLDATINITDHVIASEDLKLLVNVG